MSRITTEERFWRKVQKSDGCWEWSGARYRTGYGSFRPRGSKPVLAHRYSYALNAGKIPDGLCVLHRCDNRKCVRPGHLFLGTYRDNVADCASKGRRRYRSGVTHPNAKLNPEVVAEIRRMYAPGKFGPRRIAPLFGVGITAVYSVIKRTTWKSIP